MRSLELYEQLKPRRGTPREVVVTHQRGRLHSAMIEVCRDRGYAKATVGDVTARAGVSKKTLYRCFENKEGCFLDTYDLVVGEAMGRISAAYRDGIGREGEWSVGLCNAFEAFTEELVARPGPSRLALVDVLAAGPAALERSERVEVRFTRMVAQSLARAPGEVEIPRSLLRSLVGGAGFLARNRLLEDRAAEVSGSGRELLEWILAYRAARAGALLGAPPPPRRRPRPSPVLAFDDGEDVRARLLRAAAWLAVSAGYNGLTSGQIADLAALDEKAFAAEFESVGECFLASLDLIVAAALARALREARGAPDWPTAVCRAVRSLLCQVAEDRVLARVAFVEAFAAGTAGILRSTSLMGAFAGLLQRRAPAVCRPTPLVAEAIVGAVWSLAHRHVVHDRADLLPSRCGQASYLVLAPIVGAEEAIDAVLADLQTAPLTARLSA